MKIYAIFALLGAATALNAQSLPDCRTPTLPLKTQCVFTGSTLPTQVYVGDISLPSSEHVHLTEPFTPGTPAPVVARGKYPYYSIGGMFTVQSETLGYKALVSSGGKLFATRQWSDWRGIDIRGTAIETSLDGLGRLPGNNHTRALTIGPRVQHSFGRVTPYAEIEVGVLHQYHLGMSEGGIFGASVRVNKHFSVVPADVEYRYASLQDSSRLENPRRGRIELSAGLTYNFSK